MKASQAQNSEMETMEGHREIAEVALSSDAIAMKKLQNGVAGRVTWTKSIMVIIHVSA